ncbi:MAG: nodulation protein NfeD [Tepidanaerobacter acetatoxydans]|uniref:NfeD family protein n=1 Tax=Tepidanaerobacter acetatoxydans TaxID=499229 RepID=UPI0026EBEA01|nr:NfeD family protein [Tepidanaerobacter acetatoxydans]NLU10543.1 nodulation protein NfeD [Tepidanaerobacter acetatoxydans]
MRYKEVLITIFLICLIFAPVEQSLAENAIKASEYVYIVPVRGVIDNGLATFVIRGIREAEEMQAKALIFEIDTPGGEVGSAIKISNAILKTSIPTVSFINNEATSAGVIIAISSKTIMAVPGATIGAAETRPNEEKYISYWSSALRAVAEKTGRDPQLVAAMADADIVIEGVKEKGKILSLTTGEAIKLGLVDEQADSLDQVVQRIINDDIKNVEVVKADMNLSERIAHMASNPYVAPVLLTVGIVGTITEILTPGFGIPGVIGLIAFGLFFGGSFMAGAAQSWVLGLFIIGLLLLVIEMFIPGFGVFGVSGILSIIGSVIMAFPSLEQALISILFAMAASGLIIYFLMKRITVNPIFNRIILGTKQEKSEGYIAVNKDMSEFLGARGKTVTPLRPAGTAIIGERKVDVLAEGEFIPSGSDIVVIRVEGSKIIVKSIERENV